MAASDTIFPIELYRPVVNFLVDDRPALCRLSLTSGAFKHEAERSLYYKFRSKDIDLHKAFLTAITLSENHGFLVNTYAFIPDQPLDTELRDLMGLALKAMKNLKLLTFRPLSRSRMVAVTDLLSNCTFQLTHFDWVHPETKAFYLVPFLESQVALRSIHMNSDFNSMEAIRFNALPDLNQVGGDEKILELLLPGRSVRKVRWRPRHGPASEPSAVLLGSLRSVRLLALPPPYARPLLPILASYLENLEVLKLIVLDVRTHF